MGAGTKVPGGGGLAVKIVEGFGLFKCERALIHIVHEPSKARMESYRKNSRYAFFTFEGENSNAKIGVFLSDLTT